MAPSSRSEFDTLGAPFSQKSALTKLGAYMRGEGCRKHCPNSGSLLYELRFFGLTRALVRFYVLVVRKLDPALNHAVILLSGFDHAIQTDSEWTARHGGRSRGHAAPVGDSRCIKSSRDKIRLRNRLLWCLYGAHRRTSGTLVPDSGVRRGQRQDYDDRGALDRRLPSGAGRMGGV